MHIPLKQIEENILCKIILIIFDLKNEGKLRLEPINPES